MTRPRARDQLPRAANRRSVPVPPCCTGSCASSSTELIGDVRLDAVDPIDARCTARTTRNRDAAQEARRLAVNLRHADAGIGRAPRRRQPSDRRTRRPASPVGGSVGDDRPAPCRATRARTVRPQHEAERDAPSATASAASSRRVIPQILIAVMRPPSPGYGGQRAFERLDQAAPAPRRDRARS